MSHTKSGGTRNALPKILLVIGSVLMIGCSPNHQDNAATSSPPPKQDAGSCQNRPTQSLDAQSVQSVQLSEQDSTISGMVNQNKQLGYTFEAKSGQTLKYKTEDQVCIWVYAPDNQLLSDGKIAHDGKYLVQISALKGSTTFSLKASLISPQSAAAEPPLNSPPASSTAEERDPANFIQDHYAKLNDRNYKFTWTSLSPEFKQKVGSFSEYVEWWDSVARVEIGSVRIVSQENENAIVDADLQYQMKNGETRRDDKNRIYLVWNSEEKHWDIYEKGSS
jgi:hypothetical protein